MNEMNKVILVAIEFPDSDTFGKCSTTLIYPQQFVNDFCFETRSH